MSSSISVPNCLLLPQNPQLFHHSAGLLVLTYNFGALALTKNESKKLDRIHQKQLC